jgi:electron transfer flavoprotein beta subunit
MNIMVCIKRVAVLGDDVEFVDDARDVDPDYLDFALNEWDSYAVEEALRLREAHGGEVVVVSVGDDESDAELRRCLAMGADRAVRVWNDDLEGVHDPISIAGALAAAADAPDLVLCGAQSADGVQGATGGALAGLLELPVVSVVTKVDVDGASARVHRELEGGVVDVVDVSLPAVLTIQSGINEPRYVTLRAIQEARTRDVELVELDELGAPAYRVREMRVPEKHHATSLGDDAAGVAQRILELVREAAR